MTWCMNLQSLQLEGVITSAETDKYGFTPSCPGCDAKTRGEVARRGHSEACRKRIEGLMQGNVEDRRKLERSDERITHQIARKLEREDKKRKAVGGAHEEIEAPQAKEQDVVWKPTKSRVR